MLKPTKQSYNRTMTAFRQTDMYPKLKEYCSAHSLRLNETLLEAIASWKPYSRWAKNKYPSKKMPPPNEGLREYCKENGLKQNFAISKAVEEFIRERKKECPNNEIRPPRSRYKSRMLRG